MKKYYQLDAGSMYPKIFISFCLSPENYISHDKMPIYFPTEAEVANRLELGYVNWSKTDWGKYLVENNIIPIPVTYRQSIEELKQIKEYKDSDFLGINKLRGIYYFKQNPDAILVKSFEEPMKWKADLKAKLKTIHENDPLKEVYKQEYDSSKRFNNSGFGGSGNIYNCLFKIEVFNSDTFLARDLMLYCKNKAEALGYELIFIDTDSFVIYAEETISKLLNGWAMDWAIDKYGNYKFQLNFENEGYYKSLYVGSNCRYMGYLVKENGEVEEKIRGLQVKRKSSTLFQKREQKQFLKWLLEGHKLEEIIKYIEGWIERIYQEPLMNLATPCKFSKPREKYGKNEEFFTAYDNTKNINKKFNKEIEEQFYYIHINEEPYLIAFDKSDLSLVSKYTINYISLIEKQIFNLLVPTFAGINLGKELLNLSEKYKIILASGHRNTLLEEYQNAEELTKYYSSKEVKNRLYPQDKVIKKSKKKTLTNKVK